MALEFGVLKDEIQPAGNEVSGSSRQGHILNTATREDLKPFQRIIE